MRPKSHLSAALSFIAIIILVWYAFHSQTPSSDLEGNLPATQWSTQRALDHVKNIAVAPHYSGSTAHKTTQEYLTNQLQKLGLEIQTQDGYALSYSGVLAHPTNIMARIKGTNSTGALLVMSHYDSDPHSSYGASDAGSGVATILEGIRAFIASDKKPQNDIIILFTDAEELGLSGADIFVNKHPWAQDVAMVLNFEARGSGGPSYVLVETNGGNKKIIQSFQDAGVQHPVANSLAYSIYKMIPNDTDLTIFREDGNINGLNFAFIGDHYDYHTALDMTDRLDTNTLAHQGSYLMPLLEHYATINLSKKLQVNRGEDLVYFPLPVVGLITFSFSWIAFLTIGAGLFLLLTIIYGVRSKRMRLRSILAGFIPFLGSMIVAVLISIYGYKLMSGSVFYTDQLHKFPYNGYWLIAASSMLAVALCMLFYHWFYNRNRIAGLSVAPVFFMWLVTLLICFPSDDGGLLPYYLPGAAFFIIPVILATVLILINIRQHRPSFIVMVLLSIPAIFIFVPFIKGFPVALGMPILFVAALLTTIVFGLLVPLFAHYRRKDVLGAFTLFITVICVVYAFAKAEFSSTQPQSTSLVYTLNQSTQTAQWATYDSALNDWTSDKMTVQNTQTATDDNIMDSKYNSGFSFTNPAAFNDLNAIKVDVLNDTITGDSRTIKLNISSREKTHRLEVFCEKKFQFSKAVINGVVAPPHRNGNVLTSRRGNRLISDYVVDDEPLVLELTFNKNVLPQFSFYAASFNLLDNPVLNVKPRPDDMMPMPFVLNDAILVQLDYKVPTISTAQTTAINEF